MEKEVSLKEMKYPTQISKVARKNATLGVDFHLCQQQEINEKMTPMEIHAGWSRYVLTLLFKNEDNKYASIKANIPQGDVDYLYEKTNYANNYLFEKNNKRPSETRLEKKQSEILNLMKNIGNLCFKTLKHLNPEAKMPKSKAIDTTSDAFTICLQKYKTSPVQVILNLGQEEGFKALNQQISWLEQNLSNPKYKENNTKHIVAIKDAMKLSQEGLLADLELTDTNICLYNSGKKYFRGEKKGDLFKTYSISINFDSSKEYPYEINITNAYCSVETQTDKTVRIGTENEDAVTRAIKLSAGEWTNIIKTMARRKEQFEMLYFKNMLKIMDEYSFKPNK